MEAGRQRGRVGRTRERQEILHLLTEHMPDGMSPREIAEALDKNYHTTRSLLRKMEEAGDITHYKKHYIALSNEQALRPSLHVSPSPGSDATDDSDDVDDTESGSNSSFSRSSSPVQQTVQPVVDTSNSPGSQREHESQQQEPSDASLINDRSDSPVISVINHHQCHQRNQLQPPVPQEEVSGAYPSAENSMPQTEQGNSPVQEKMRCPHHPQERQVRFDLTGQAWCDQMNCWDCYRLMRIGEVLDFPCLIDCGGQRLIEQGKEAWSRFVCIQRAFLIVVATEEAVLVCNTLGIKVPDLSKEVSRLETISLGP